MKDLKILPVVPFDTGVTMKGVPGPLIVLGRDMTKFHPMIQEAFSHCLELEIGLQEENDSTPIIKL